LDTLRQVVGVQEDVDAVFAILERLGEDVEPVVRAELMEQIPHIAMYSQEVPEYLVQVVPLHLLPLVVKFLTDKNNQVRKTSQAALLVLLEQGLVDKADVEEQVCPVIIKFTEADSLDDYRTEAVALLSKMAPMIGREMSERLFLERFAALCVDPLFHVRKVCAANFGDFSGVVGPESTEKILLPKFFYLCGDGVWGVRKACADVFMPVSCVCSPTVRQAELSPLFINLLRDQSRWVRMAAFQALGPFISTFADPLITALLHNENGEIIITDPDQLKIRLNLLEQSRLQAKTAGSPESQSTNAALQNSVNNNTNEDEANTANNNVVVMDEREEDEWSSQLVATSSPNKSVEERRAGLYFSAGRPDNADFSEFMYWREPVADLVDIDLDAEMTDVQQDVSAQLETVRQDLARLDVESSTDTLLEAPAPQEHQTETAEQEIVKDNTTEKTEFKEVNKMEEEEDKETKELSAVEQENSSSEKESSSSEKESSSSEQESSSIDQESSSSEKETSSKEHESSSNQQESSSSSNETSSSGEGTEGSSSNDGGSQESSSIEMFRGSGVEKEISDNISTFDPQNRWGSYSSLHSSRSSLDSRAADAHPPDPALPKGPPETDQAIVPQLLIDHYVSMIDPSRAQTVDNDIARHCAFSLPAVALTLGRSNWPLLLETYQTLANDMQWKVRRTLASSIHELGVILGEEVASKDLVPIFNGFIKDLDEVRIGMLKHLAEFLRLLQEKERREYLPKLEEFLKMDNERNWRFRLELADQLGLLVNLFPAEDVKAFLAPIALSLVQDRVAAVRCAATLVVSNMIQTHHSSLNTYLIAELVDKLANSSHWSRRQTFGVLCGELVKSIPYTAFSQDLLPHLLELAFDLVPNVRLSVARVLGRELPDEYYEDERLPCRDQIVSTLNQLASDRDTDVREAAASGLRVEARAPPKEESVEAVAPTVVVESEDKEGDEDEVPSWAQIASK